MLIVLILFIIEFFVVEMKCGVLLNKIKFKKSFLEEVGCFFFFINFFEKSFMEYFLIMFLLVCDCEVIFFIKY